MVQLKRKENNLRGKIAKQIRKGCKNKGLTKDDYKANKKVYSTLGIEIKQEIRKAMKKAGNND